MSLTHIYSDNTASNKVQCLITIAWEHEIKQHERLVRGRNSLYSDCATQVFFTERK